MSSLYQKWPGMRLTADFFSFSSSASNENSWIRMGQGTCPECHPPDILAVPRLSPPSFSLRSFQFGCRILFFISVYLFHICVSTLLVFLLSFHFYFAVFAISAFSNTAALAFMRDYGSYFTTGFVFDGEGMGWIRGIVVFLKQPELYDVRYRDMGYVVLQYDEVQSLQCWFIPSKKNAWYLYAVNQSCSFVIEVVSVLLPTPRKTHKPVML